MAIKRILIATDFSNHSFEAARVAVVLGHRAGADLALFHAVELAEHEVIPASVRAAELSAATAECERLMMSERQRLRQLCHTDLEMHLMVRSGDPAREILHCAAEWNASMIVLSTLGAGGGLRSTFGSVAARVTRSARCPVLVVRNTHEIAWQHVELFQHPLVAIDYSRFSLPAIKATAELTAPGCEIALVHIFRAPLRQKTSLEFARALGAARAAELERLQSFAARVEEVPVAVELRSEMSHIADQLLDYVTSARKDLVIIGAHGRDGATEMLGSVADRILDQSPVPVLVIPEAALPQRS